MKPESGARYPHGEKAARKYALSSLLRPRTDTGAGASARVSTAHVFILPCVMNDIPSVNDDVGRGIERVNVRNRECEIAYSLIGIGCIQDQMSIGDLSDDHFARFRSFDCRPASYSLRIATTS